MTAKIVDIGNMKASKDLYIQGSHCTMGKET